MGSSSSKPARKLGKEAVSSQPLRTAGASRTEAPRPQPPPRLPPTFGDVQADRGTTGARGVSASESKSQAVRDDAQDPHLLSNLHKLGPVDVPRGKIKMKSSNRMLGILAAREKNAAEEEQAGSIDSTSGKQASGQLKNRMSASAILQMLDERKGCQTQKEIEQLAVAYDFDESLLDRLVRYVNSPSVETGQKQEAQRQKQMETDDDTPPRVNAIWTEPALKDIEEIPSAR